MCVSQHAMGRGCLPLDPGVYIPPQADTTLGRQHPLGRHPQANTTQADTPLFAETPLGRNLPDRHTPLKTGTEADGTYPTGMHFSFSLLLEIKTLEFSTLFTDSKSYQHSGNKMYRSIFKICEV